ncbi:hypothetical protein D3C85_1285550 [compost metagenome]
MELAEQVDQPPVVMVAPRLLLQQQVLAQVLHGCAVPPPAELGDDADLDQPPSFEQGADLLVAGQGHPGALVRFGGDQAIGLQLLQRRAHRGAADIEQLRQRRLAQFHAGPQRAVADGLVNPLVDAVDRGFQLLVCHS